MLHYYYPRTIKNIVIALMDLFNDIRVYKYDSNETPIAEYHVPITFGPVQKYHQDRIEKHYFDTSAVDLSGYTQVTEVNQNYYLQTPRMALILNSITYNSERCYGPNEWRYWFKQSLELTETDLEKVFVDLQPTPYDFNFTLEIMTNSTDYFSQIMENILPYFNPKLYLRVKEFSFLNIERDLPVSLGNIPLDFLEEHGENDVRQINTKLELTVEAFLYRPWTYSKIIKVINSKYYVHNVNVVCSETSAITSGSTIVKSFSTSGYMTSGGQYLSGTNPPTTYDFSGVYQDENKSFNWFSNMIDYDST